MNDRRGFLRGLVSLPLIGGGVTLIGNPTAAAPAVTDEMLGRYVAWLAHEHRAAIVEQERRRAETVVANMIRSGETPVPGWVDAVVRDKHDYPHMFWFPDAPDIQASIAASPPSSRAAVVLSAVGCSLREGGR